MAKIIGVVPVAILGDPTKSNMNDYFKVGNNYAKRVLESACVPIGMVPVDYWLTEEALDLCDGFIVQGGDEFPVIVTLPCGSGPYEYIQDGMRALF